MTVLNHINTLKKKMRIIKKKLNIWRLNLKENSKSVNLNGSIKACYSNNLLLMFYKNNEFKSIVNFSYVDALNMINKYSEEQILLMQELCSNIIGLNEKEKIKQIVKK